MDVLLREFLVETSEGIAKLDAELIKLEENPNNAESLNIAFRLLHTIKGTCGFLGLQRLERIIHAGENVLGKFRDDGLPVTATAVNLILSSLDLIKSILLYLEQHESEPVGDDSDLISALDALAEGEEGSFKRVEIATQQDMRASSMEPVLSDNNAMKLSIAEKSTRVDVDLLDDLMTRVGELVLTRNQLLHAMGQQEDSVYLLFFERLNRIISELQVGVMKARMQPIGHAWSKLPRIVRDLSHQLHKKINLQMSGAETEIDQQILELIRDPLMHMVRNAADHGIELPDERIFLNKTEIGTIVLNAHRNAGHIVVEVSDDGRGLALDKIKTKILQKGWATEVDLSGMSDQQVMSFIFKPGFSTASTVTFVSGRGVGLDVVRTNVEKIGGTIDFQSEPGKGTTFYIKIPSESIL